MANDDEKKLFRELEKLDTEQRNDATQNIDLADAYDIARLINQEDHKVAPRVEEKLPQIAEGIDLIKTAFAESGRLIYVGAGTSGRLGILDASECPPTFGTDPTQVIALIAGGKEAVFESQEEAEDREEYGRKALCNVNVAPTDVLCGLAASGRTPYVHGALKMAREKGCKTIFITTVPANQITIEVDVLIDIPVGPEVIMGSTRMKSATAQKMVLNMLSTGAMIRRGKVYENVMVDLKLSNNKLQERAKRVVMMFTGLDYDKAEKRLEEAGNHVKTAIVMELASVEKKDAQKLLSKHDGFIRRILQQIKAQP